MSLADNPGREANIHAELSLSWLEEKARNSKCLSPIVMPFERTERTLLYRAVLLVLFPGADRGDKSVERSFSQSSSTNEIRRKLSKSEA
jgi:hypothetical protein